MSAFFIFKNIDSRDMGVIVNKLPSITKPEKQIEKIEIEGRDGFLTVDHGGYQGTVKTVECTLDNGDINQICAWLDGSGEVIFSNEDDKVYKAVIINQISLDKIIPILHTFLIQFECQPHKYSVNNDVITLNSTPATINNLTTALSKPIIKVYGTGAIELTVNSNVIHLTNIVDYVTIDSEMVDCYKDSQLMNNNMLGEFPILEIGTNSISWIGTVTKIEIIPNWRWI